MILVSRYIVPRGYLGITIFPFVFVKHENLKLDEALINHERIHLRQQLEFLILPFFMWYIVEFFIRYIQFRNWSLAYKNISFEREAYKEECSKDFLKKRPFLNFLQYLN